MSNEPRLSHSRPNGTAAVTTHSRTAAPLRNGEVRRLGGSIAVQGRIQSIRSGVRRRENDGAYQLPIPSFKVSWFHRVDVTNRRLGLRTAPFERLSWRVIIGRVR